MLQCSILRHRSLTAGEVGPTTIQASTDVPPFRSLLPRLHNSCRARLPWRVRRASRAWIPAMKAVRAEVTGPVGVLCPCQHQLRPSVPVRSGDRVACRQRRSQAGFLQSLTQLEAGFGLCQRASEGCRGHFFFLMPALPGARLPGSWVLALVSKRRKSAALSALSTSARALNFSIICVPRYLSS